MQLGHRHGAGHGHEVARKSRHVLDAQVDGETRLHHQVFGRLDFKTELHRQGVRARDQDLGMAIAQQVVQAREKAFDLVFALRHLGGTLALEDVGAGGGGHAQGFHEQAGEFAHAEEDGQFVGAGDPAVFAQQRRAARRPSVMPQAAQ
ncbi:hypothetical protein [Massilia sp. Dwa41.01b]|uniref:hypothetical protein n=1 Tax=Massilia sp. Dwa41.01b TaxID=2709302 RepID=UPI001E585C9B|nr:hypothetical protein [Massilia sp. Dwa41.01b]